MLYSLKATLLELHWPYAEFKVTHRIRRDFDRFSVLACEVFRLGNLCGSLGLRAAQCDHLPLAKNHDEGGISFGKCNVVCCQYDRSSFHQRPFQAFCEDRCSGVRIYGTETVVKKEVACVGIDGSSQSNALLLASGNGHTAFAHAREVAFAQSFQVTIKCASFQNRLVSFVNVGTAK